MDALALKFKTGKSTQGEVEDNVIGVQRRNHETLHGRSRLSLFVQGMNVRCPNKGMSYIKDYWTLPSPPALCE